MPQTSLSTTPEYDNKSTNMERTRLGFHTGMNFSDERNSAKINAFAGACAGCTAKTIVAPIERVKLLMQLQGSINMNRTNKKRSALNVAFDVYRSQGVLAFWRGNTPNVIRQGGTSAVNFMLMDSYKRAIAPILSYTLSFPSNKSQTQRVRTRARLSSFLSGGLAGGTTTTVLYPIEFLRTRLAMDMGNSVETRKYPRGMRDVFFAVYKVDGLRGLYQGYGIAVAGVILYRGLHLGGYDAVKNEILYRKNMNIDENEKLSMTERFASAQIVSIVAGTMCYPIDSVRRRLMMQAGLPQNVVRKYSGSLDCFKKVAKEEGMKGFYLGIGPNVIRSFGGALLLVGYDLFKGMII